MNRLAINGSDLSMRNYLTKALSKITGIEMIPIPSYSSIASRYQFEPDEEMCVWSHSYAYCLGAFTQRIIEEQKRTDSYISEAGVFNELCWIQFRDVRIESIYQSPVVSWLEKIAFDYAMNHYDLIFHIDSNDPADLINRYLKRKYEIYKINCQIITATTVEDGLNQILAFMQK